MRALLQNVKLLWFFVKKAQKFITFFPFFQNLLFYYDNEASTRPSGLIFLEGCYCERLISAPSCLGSAAGTSSGQGSKSHKEEKLQVSFYKLFYLFLICVSNH